jgi:RNA-binding protein 39
MSANWKLDDDDGVTGMQLNAQSRASLMAKLGQAAGLQMPNVSLNATPSSVPQNVMLQGPPPIMGKPSIYLMIQNMFILEEETGKNWEQDLKEDVFEECSKYGKIMQCVVETRRSGGFIYLQFSSIESAGLAAAALNGRYFAGRMIQCTYLDAGQFVALTG